MKKLTALLLTVSLLGISAGAEIYSAPESSDDNIAVVSTAAPEMTSPPAATTSPKPSEIPTSKPAETAAPEASPTVSPKVSATRTPNQKVETYDIIINGYKLSYYIEKEGGARIIKIDYADDSKTAGDLTIPAKLNGIPLTGLAYSMMYVPTTVNVKGRRPHVRELTLPDTLEEIEYFAFNGADIEKINLPKNLKRIGESAFSGCTLKKITLPDTLTSIGRDAFAGSDLTEIYIPDSVNSIDYVAFRNCKNLKTVRIPASLKDCVDKGVFDYCTAIENIIYDGEYTDSMKIAFLDTPAMKKYANEHSNGLFMTSDTLLKYTGNEKEVTIPEGIKIIYFKCFADTEVEKVNFPSTLETIRSGAFAKTDLKELRLPASTKRIMDSAFKDCKKLEKVVVEGGGKQLAINDIAFDGCKSLKEVVLPSYAIVSQTAFDYTPFEGLTKFPNKEQPTPLPTAEPTAEPTKSPIAPNTPSVPDSSRPVLNVMDNGGKIEINAGGSEVAFPDAAPFIDENDRTQLPIRAVAESIGCKVDYDTATQTVSVKGNDESIVLSIGDENMIVNGKTVKMDTAARIVNDRTYIPVRFVAEALGFDVNYITAANQN